MSGKKGVKLGNGHFEISPRNYSLRPVSCNGPERLGQWWIGSAMLKLVQKGLTQYHLKRGTQAIISWTYLKVTIS
jgi:hypothetical protein